MLSVRLNESRSPVRIGSSLAALTAALCVSTAAFAQDAPAQAPAPVANGNPVASDQDAEAIIVTGSRIAATGFTAPTPVTVIGEQDIERKAVSNVADILNAVPSFRAQSTPATTA